MLEECAMLEERSACPTTIHVRPTKNMSYHHACTTTMHVQPALAWVVSGRWTLTEGAKEVV